MPTVAPPAIVGSPSSQQLDRAQSLDLESIIRHRDPCTPIAGILFTLVISAT